MAAPGMVLTEMSDPGSMSKWTVATSLPDGVRWLGPSYSPGRLFFGHDWITMPGLDSLVFSLEIIDTREKLTVNIKREDGEERSFEITRSKLILARQFFNGSAREAIDFFLGADRNALG